MAWANNNPKHVPTTTRRRILNRDGHRCRQCGGQESLEVDHINNQRGAGYDDDGNLQVLCRRCHQAKTAFESGQWRRKVRRTSRPSIGLT